MTKIAVIRIRGEASDLKRKLCETMNMLHLYKKNYCALIDATPSQIGMLNKVKDYTTWGEIDKETLKSLLQKRGKLPANKPLTEEYLKEKVNLTFDKFTEEIIENKKSLKEIPGMKLFFRLKPPEHGFERGGIKKPFSMGGVLGYRKEKINELIKRML